MANRTDLVFLIGMPGCGKSYWARNLARHYRYSFRDLDKEIEAQEGKTVRELFSLYGEGYFRDAEQQALNRTIASATGPFLVSTGGGLPCYLDNMDRMRESGITVYLRARTATLVGNLRHNLAKRPLLQQAANLEDTLTAMLQKRKPFYNLADHIFDVESLTKAQFDPILLPHE